MRERNKVAVILITAVVVALISAGALFFGIRALPSGKGEICKGIEVLLVSKGDIETDENGTVHIRCIYRLQNTTSEDMNVRIGGIFENEEETGFLVDGTLTADGVYTVPAGSTESISVEFEGRNGSCDTVPDRLAPVPVITEA